MIVGIKNRLEVAFIYACDDVRIKNKLPKKSEILTVGGCYADLVSKKGLTFRDGGSSSYGMPFLKANPWSP